MKQKKRLLVSSFAMLLVSILTLTSVTYAWFTSGDAATVSGVQFHAEAQEGIQISVGKETENGNAWTWGSTVTADQLKKVTANLKQLNRGQLAPVSTTGDNLKTGLLFKGTVSDTTLNAEEAAVSSTDNNYDGYYAFDLYFKNDGSSNKTIVLDVANSKVTANTGTEATPVTDVGLQNATRVAFVVVDSAPNATSLDTSKVDAEHASSKVVIWEPNATAHNDTVEATYGVTDGNVYEYLGVNAAGAWTLGYVNNGILGLSNASGSAPKVEVKNGTSNFDLFSISANETVKITVFIWIEGQDVDCINYASSGVVDTILKFVVKSASSN